MTTWFKEILGRYKHRFDYRLETLISDITEQISIQMQIQNLSRSQLAGKMNVTPAAITKILRGNNNFTIRTLLGIADALGTELSVEFRTHQASKQLLTQAWMPFIEHPAPLSAADETLVITGELVEQSGANYSR